MESIQVAVTVFFQRQIYGRIGIVFVVNQQHRRLTV
jgi:hypothetical protein